MGIAKGSKVIQPGDKEMRNVYDVLLEAKELAEASDYDNAVLLHRIGLALEFAEGLL